MKTILHNRLATLDAKYKRTPVTKRLRVFYGWNKVNKIRKKEAISVVFENGCQRDERTMKFINRMMDVVYVRDQTEDEKKGAEGAIRMFSEYSVFLDEKRFHGSLELGLRCNFESDKNNVSEEERATIRKKLRESYLVSHQGYNEPVVQLELKFEE
ncbi:MAG: hypothetical protein K2M59_03775 [Muribaculaceae bacterium]|nr:hypothetical protein [Muribaculaceae bacterium]MDE7465529.1 hypothetical protein [Muribaculaceae bacterium]